MPLLQSWRRVLDLRNQSGSPTQEKQLCFVKPPPKQTSRTTCKTVRFLVPWHCGSSAPLAKHTKETNKESLGTISLHDQSLPYKYRAEFSYTIKVCPTSTCSDRAYKPCASFHRFTPWRATSPAFTLATSSAMPFFLQRSLSACHNLLWTQCCFRFASSPFVTW